GIAQAEPGAAKKTYDAGDQDLAKAPQGKNRGLLSDSLKFRNDLVNNRASARRLVSPAQDLAFSGRVVDINNRPLAGASVFMNNAPNITTTTDGYGNFNFRFRLPDTTQQLTVALVGYKQTQVPLNVNTLTTNHIIQLEQSKASLNEVVVTGFGAK